MSFPYIRPMEDDLDIRGIRSRLGLTQAQLGDAVGVDQSTVSNWENGASPRGPARKLLERLSEQASSQQQPAFSSLGKAS